MKRPTDVERLCRLLVRAPCQQLLKREVAEELVGDDPDLTTHPLWREELEVFLADPEATEFLLKG